jgi:hypothetical protein
MVLAEAALWPWLAAEPRELRVELGRQCSRVVTRRVELDTAALVMPESFLARVDRVAVAEVELVASPWSAPGLDAVVRGVTVGRPAQSERRRRVIEMRKGEKRGRERRRGHADMWGPR